MLRPGQPPTLTPLPSLQEDRCCCFGPGMPESLGGSTHFKVSAEMIKYLPCVSVCVVCGYLIFFRMGVFKYSFFSNYTDVMKCGGPALSFSPLWAVGERVCIALGTLPFSLSLGGQVSLSASSVCHCGRMQGRRSCLPP